MSTIWLVGIVVAVVILAAVVVLRRRSVEAKSGEVPPQVEASEPVSVTERPEVAARPPRAERPEVKEPIEEAAPPRAEVTPREVEAPQVAEPPARPKLSGEELREQVTSRLADSERMLSELKEVSEASAGVETQPSVSSVAIMEEGLQEIRGLADRKQWEQARDKGEALHAQLSLLLQSARREQAS